jgi:broad specificity polyphosphatase/5'/3'-nucleotidase SurE
MRFYFFLAAALPLAHGIRIVQSNDDGWSEINLRTFFNALDAAGHQVVLSGPAENQSGTGIESYLYIPTLANDLQDHLMLRQKLLTLMAAFTLLALVEARPQEQTHLTLA